MLRTWAVVTGAVVAAVAGCGSPQWPTDPVSEPSEVTGRVWFCTPAYPTRQWDDGKDADSAVTMELVTAGPGPGADLGRFEPGTVLGRAMSLPAVLRERRAAHKVG